MKPSHLITPRTMNECVWTPGYRSAEPQRYSLADRAVMWASMFAALVCALVVLLVPEIK